MLGLQRTHLFLMSLDKILSSPEQFLSTFHIELLSLNRLCRPDLSLEHFGIFVETLLPEIVSAMLHLDQGAGEVYPRAVHRAILD